MVPKRCHKMWKGSIDFILDLFVYIMLGFYISKVTDFERSD